MKWKKIAWFDDVELLLRDALLDDVSIIREEVNAGVSVLWHVENHGYFVTRLEQFYDQKELVLVAWQGKNTKPLVDYLKKICKKSGIDSMRFHSSLPEKTVSRFVEPFGFLRAETVYRLEL